MVDSTQQMAPDSKQIAHDALSTLGAPKCPTNTTTGAASFPERS
jgi:hypothetical protein